QADADGGGVGGPLGGRVVVQVSAGLGKGGAFGIAFHRGLLRSGGRDRAGASPRCRASLPALARARTAADDLSKTAPVCTDIPAAVARSGPQGVGFAGKSGCAGPPTVWRCWRGVGAASRAA